ncbi:MAG: choloylglycine hydrolase family protein [Sporolactobacillus sp.]
MCTSLTLTTTDSKHLLGRNMDFPTDLGQNVLLTPRNYVWRDSLDASRQTRFAVLGMGMAAGDYIGYADGFNEAGLMCATLYHPGFATYQPRLEASDDNALAPSDVVFWLLSQFSELKAASEALRHTTLLDVPLPLLGVTPPLHWILSDRSGACLVAEVLKDGLHLHNNPVGVMTNAPDLPWHLAHLRQFINLHAAQVADTVWENLRLTPFGEGSGAVGLPGDFTPPSRFVRAAFLKHHLTGIDTELSGVTGLFHVLAACALPKGAVVTAQGQEDITLYTSVMCSESATYYYTGYDNQQLTAIHLFHEDLNATRPKLFPFKREQAVALEN